MSFFLQLTIPITLYIIARYDIIIYDHRDVVNKESDICQERLSVVAIFVITLKILI